MAQLVIRIDATITVPAGLRRGRRRSPDWRVRGLSEAARAPDAPLDALAAFDAPWRGPMPAAAIAPSEMA